MGQPEVMSQRRGLRDLVPEVLNVTVPEGSNQGLLRGASVAGNEIQTLDLVESPCVLVAGQLRWRSGTKFISAREGKRRDLRPLWEYTESPSDPRFYFGYSPTAALLVTVTSLF
jgi:hypothetical protein